MIKIEWDYLNELYDICNDLNILVYFQGLVQYDLDCGCDSRFEINTQNAQAYIFDRQLESVLRFKHLLEKDDFLQSLDDKK